MAVVSRLCGGSFVNGNHTCDWQRCRSIPDMTGTRPPSLMTIWKPGSSITSQASRQPAGARSRRLRAGFLWHAIKIRLYPANYQSRLVHFDPHQCRIYRVHTPFGENNSLTFWVKNETFPPDSGCTKAIFSLTLMSSHKAKIAILNLKSMT